MKTEQGDVFIAEDGRRFASADECQTYENDVLNRVKKIRFFNVWCNADLTETGQPMARTVLAVEHAIPDAAAIDYCVKKFGPAVQYLQGVAPVRGWQIAPVDADMWTKALAKDASIAVQWGGSSTPATPVFLSDNSTPLAGWPAPCAIAPSK